MQSLVQTEKCSIIYGDFRGKKNQELFRCPRELDDKDLKRYINENRCFFHLVQEDENVNDLRAIEGRKLIGYYRLYFRGDWYGRWFQESDEKVSELDCHGLDEIVDWIRKQFKRGCDFYMCDYLSQFDGISENRYFLKPYMSDRYKLMFDTTYGNGDYPIRIYVYSDSHE